MRQATGWVIAGSSVLFLGSALLWRAQGYALEWNQTPSLPRGLYSCRAVTKAAPLPPAVLVTFRLTSAQQAMVPQAGAGLMLKQIWARHPHEVCAQGDEVWVDGRLEAHRPLQEQLIAGWTGCATLGRQEYFVMGRHPRSVDSRYYGPITRAQVLEICTPLWTWGGEQ